VLASQARLEAGAGKSSTAVSDGSTSL